MFFFILLWGILMSPLTTNFSQKFTQSSKGISYRVTFADVSQKLTGPSAYTLHCKPISPTDCRNGLLWLVAYISQTGSQCFSPKTHTNLTDVKSVDSHQPIPTARFSRWSYINPLDPTDFPTNMRYFPRISPDFPKISQKL